MSVNTFSQEKSAQPQVTYQRSQTALSSKVTLGGSIKSEFYKLWTTKLTKITSLLVIIISAGLVGAVAHFSDIAPDASMIVGGWGLSSIFFLVISVGAVTSEYAHNTMRTTALSDPQRLRSLFAKAFAVVVYSFLLASVLTVIMTGTTLLLSKQPVTFTSDDVRPFLTMIGVLVGMSVMGVGLGYIFRSTAGAITAGVVLMQFLGLLTLIPLDFFRKTLNFYLPSNLGQYAIMKISSGEIVDPSVTVPYSQGGAFALFLLYPLFFLVLGIIRFKKSDI
ncbi:ABC transporter permease subunit [Arcanobacterium ihumii]|uniref:ABC transporter permease subunit n=1 Tax=Arcanobacterium ihumii TaxID=2138162 RepID=UPI00135A62EB|nr:ABC transporter permease subunit [Arcanobacterium ihumii]